MGNPQHIEVGPAKEQKSVDMLWLMALRAHHLSFIRTSKAIISEIDQILKSGDTVKSEG